jgi:predicted deacylase
MPKQIVINGTTIAPGENKQVIFSKCELPSQSIIETPAYVFRSVNDGPTVLLSAGMHGEETNGIETIRQLIKRDDIKKPLCGTIIAIPVFNVVSFIFNQRDLPDGRDLNRCFPGTKAGSLGSRVAHDIMHNILPVIDFGVDFHTGGAKINNYPQLRCVFDEPKNIELAQLFAPPFIINAPYREGSFRSEAAKQGKSILVFEAGESLRFNNTAIDEGLNGCLRLLHNLNMINVKLPQTHTIIIGKDKWLRAQEAGLFRTHKKFGSFFEKHEVIGTINDPYNKSEIKLIAPDNGFIIGINNQPVVHVGDALLHIGIEK